MLKRYNQHIASGTLNGVSNAAVTGTTLFLGNQADKVVPNSLSAFLIITAATASLTVTPSWQVSNDGSTFVNIKLAPQNPAMVVVATGAQNITTVLEAPQGVNGFQFARLLLNVAGATGAAGDLYSIGLNYTQPD